MAVRLWQRFEVSIDGVVHSGGSLTSATEIAATSNAIIDKTVVTSTTATKVLDIADITGTAFDFIWLENEDSTIGISVQITMDAGTDDVYMTYLLPAGGRLVFVEGAGQGTTGGTGIDALDGNAKEISEVWYKAASGTPSLRVVAAT